MKLTDRVKGFLMTIATLGFYGLLVPVVILIFPSIFTEVLWLLIFGGIWALMTEVIYLQKKA